MKHSTTKPRAKVILARRMRSRSDIKHSVSIFSTKAWYTRAAMIRIKSMPKKQKQEIVDRIVRQTGIKNILKKVRAYVK